MTAVATRTRHESPANPPASPPTRAREVGPRLRVRPLAPPARGHLQTAARPTPTPLLRPGIAPSHREHPGEQGGLAPDAPAPSEAPLGDPTALVCAVVRGTVEALRGERSLAQLARWVTPEIMEALTTRAALVRSVPRGTVVPRPVQVRRARVVRVGPACAEATVVVDDVDRVRAAAVRVEVHRGHWRVVALEIG